MIRTKRLQLKSIYDINITPFTDVCLVLLIIFMVTYPQIAREKERQIKIKLPQSTTADEPLPTSVVVRITHDYKIYVNNQLTTYTALQSKIKEHNDKWGTRLLVINADESIPYHYVIGVIDMARKVGVDQLALATRSPGGQVQPPKRPLP